MRRHNYGALSLRTIHQHRQESCGTIKLGAFMMAAGKTLTQLPRALLNCFARGFHTFENLIDVGFEHCGAIRPIPFLIGGFRFGDHGICPEAQESKGSKPHFSGKDNTGDTVVYWVQKLYLSHCK